MLDKPQKLRSREINLIPMINVIFLLLTFFMVAGSIDKVDPFALNLPDASKNNAGKPQRVHVVYMHKDGRIAVNNDLVTRKDFYTIIHTLMIENKNAELIIKADSEVSSTDLIWVMRNVENAGGKDVSIVTKIGK